MQFQGGLSETLAGCIASAALDPSPVSGLTHQFYRYPARFSPKFARTCIETFTKPGDVVFDPFCGGGTTLVEALALGRHAIGSDVNELAVFVSRVKTARITKKTLEEATESFNRVLSHMENNKLTDSNKFGLNEIAHLGHRDTWRIRNQILLGLTKISNLSCHKSSDLIRCSILKTAQWALDGRKTVPSVSLFRQQLTEYFDAIIRGSLEFSEATRFAWRGKSSSTRLIVSSAQQLNRHKIGRRPISLILTSPPYPGIHVLYHRWQVRGRLETSAPYWISNALDGAGPSHYTMGPRRQKNWDVYFNQISASMIAIRQTCSPGTLLIQMVGFSKIAEQLHRYLKMMNDAGFEEVSIKTDDETDGRIWRQVPNRKWHAEMKGPTPGSNEVVLIHRAK